jgi:hypothetical protein
MKLEAFLGVDVSIMVGTCHFDSWSWRKMVIFFSYLSRCIKAGSCPTCNALLNLLSRLDTPLYTEGLEERFWQVRSTAERVVYAERMESPLSLAMINGVLLLW